MRHPYRRKLLTTILARLGHCESYDFGLELETAIAKALDEVSTTLTPQIIKGEGNEVFHFEWDNMNKITTNIHGSNVFNSTAGIMIQEVQSGFSGYSQKLIVDGPATRKPVDFKLFLANEENKRKIRGNCASYLVLSNELIKVELPP